MELKESVAEKLKLLSSACGGNNLAIQKVKLKIVF